MSYLSTAQQNSRNNFPISQPSQSTRMEKSQKYEQNYPKNMQDQLQYNQQQIAVQNQYGLKFSNLVTPYSCGQQNNFSQKINNQPLYQNQQQVAVNPIRQNSSNQSHLSKSQVSYSPQTQQQSQKFSLHQNSPDQSPTKQQQSQPQNQNAFYSQSSIIQSQQQQFNKPQENSRNSFDQIQRARGCLFGAFLGDSMGAYLEFTKNQINDQLLDQALKLPGGGIFKLLGGQLTDDGELTIMLAEGILLSKNLDCTQIMINVMQCYCFWVNSRPFDFGLTMQNSWEPFNFTKWEVLLQKHNHNEEQLFQYIVQNAAKTSKDSESNGFLMKQSSLAIFLWNQSIETIFKFAELETQITHSKQICLEISQIYLYILTQLIKRGKQESFKIYSEVRQIAWQYNFSVQMKEIFCTVEAQFDGISESQIIQGLKKNIYAKQYPEFPNFYKIYKAEQKIGWVVIPFSYSLYILIESDKSQKELFRNILALGGDTDTNLCIVGAVYGAQNGINEFSNEYKEKIKQCDPTQNSQQRRPKIFSPSRYEELADQLFKLGNKAVIQSPKKNSEIKSEIQNLINEKTDQLKSKQIQIIQNCTLESLENCQVTIIKNCFIKNIVECRINKIEQSRLERIQKTQIDQISHCIIQDSKYMIDTFQNQIKSITETKLGISYL